MTPTPYWSGALCTTLVHNTHKFRCAELQEHSTLAGNPRIDTNILRYVLACSRVTVSSPSLYVCIHRQSRFHIPPHKWPICTSSDKNIFIITQLHTTHTSKGDATIRGCDFGPRAMCWDGFHCLTTLTAIRRLSMHPKNKASCCITFLFF